MYSTYRQFYSSYIFITDVLYLSLHLSPLYNIITKQMQNSPYQLLLLFLCLIIFELVCYNLIWTRLLYSWLSSAAISLLALLFFTSATISSFRLTYRAIPFLLMIYKVTSCIYFLTEQPTSNVYSVPFFSVHSPLHCHVLFMLLSDSLWIFSMLYKVTLPSSYWTATSTSTSIFFSVYIQVIFKSCSSSYIQRNSYIFHYESWLK